MPECGPPRMEKLVYLLWRDASESADAFARRLVGTAGPKLVGAGARSGTGNGAAARADLGKTVPIRSSAPEFAGLVSFWLGCVDDRPAYEPILRESAARVAGYLVTESVPRDFGARSWPDGVRSPGVKLISAFEQPTRLTREEFIARWHGSHPPLSLQVHPRRCYVHNVVAPALTARAPNFPGIVAQH